MSLRDSITADATAVFLNTDEFAETVTYYPRAHASVAARANRTITAVVVRETLAGIGPGGEEVLMPRFQVTVPNDSTDGISGEELDLGGDQIGLSIRDGEDAARRAIVSVISQDHGMLVLECR